MRPQMRRRSALATRGNDKNKSRTNELQPSPSTPAAMREGSSQDKTLWSEPIALRPRTRRLCMWVRCWALRAPPGHIVCTIICATPIWLPRRIFIRWIEGPGLILTSLRPAQKISRCSALTCHRSIPPVSELACVP